MHTFSDRGYRHNPQNRRVAKMAMENYSIVAYIFSSLWNIKNEERRMRIMKKHTSMRWWQYAMLVLGVSVCLMAAFLVFEGNILGENNTGWASVIGIVGIGLLIGSIGTSGAMIAGERARSLKPKK